MGREPPAHSDRRVYDLYIAGRQSAALAAAVRTGLFDALAPGPLSASELASRLGLAERPVALLCRALVAMGLLERVAGGHALAPDAARHLVRGRPEWLGGLIDLEVENFLSPALLLAALRGDSASVYGGEDPWQRHASDPEAAAAFTAAMHGISVIPATAFASAVDAADVRRVLDVGGGSGALSIALARAWPDLRCTIFDLERVCALAGDYVADAGLSGRVTVHAGDFWSEGWPPGHDAVLLAQILHDWRPERCAELLARAFAALPRGGRIWVHEKLVAEDGSAPLANQLVDLDMLVWTEGQQWTEPGLRELLATVGFEDVGCRPTAGYWSLISGRRP